jgi:cytoskeletal protein RodZ
VRAVFISYRREDSEGEAGRLFGDLAAQFGKSNVFMDVTGIAPGRDFRKIVDKNVASCGVLLAIIGKGWIDAKDDVGRRRLDDPLDFVRLETASALKRDIPVIPVLVRGAPMPRAEQLPEDIKDLVYRNGVELTHARWESDVELLIKAIRPDVEDAKPSGAGGRAGDAAPPERIVATATDRRPRRARLWWLVASVAAVGLAAVGLTTYEYRKAQETAALEAAAREAAAREAAAKEAVAREAAAKQAAAREAAVKEAAARQAAAREVVAREAAAKEAAARGAAAREAAAREAAAKEAAAREAAAREAAVREAAAKEAAAREAAAREAAAAAPSPPPVPTYQAAVPGPGQHNGYITSSLQPGQTINGTVSFNQKGGFEYVGSNGVRVTGMLNMSNPANVTGFGTTLLPSLLGLIQSKYPDGSTGTQITIRGRIVNGVLQGQFSDKFETGQLMFNLGK